MSERIKGIAAGVDAEPADEAGGFVSHFKRVKVAKPKLVEPRAPASASVPVEPKVVSTPALASPFAAQRAKFLGALKDIKPVEPEEVLKIIKAKLEPEPEEVELKASPGPGTALIVAPEHSPEPTKPVVVLASSAPYDIAGQFIADRYWSKAAGLGLLQFWQLQFWQWKANHWSVIDPNTMRAQLYDYLNNAQVRVDRKVTVYQPNMASVSNVVDALKGSVNIEPEVLMPGWLGKAVPPPVGDLRELIPCSNGLLDVRSRRLFLHSPRFWSANVFDFAYDHSAKAPRFEQFLKELWPGDEDTQQAVLEMIGVCLTDETKYQKMWMFVGHPRSGKGTLGRLIKGLIGEDNYLGTTLQSFADPFGMESFIGKKVVVFSDATLEGIDRKGMSKITERLKLTSGEDDQHINRKNIKYWDGTLTARIVFFSNDLLGFRDDSTALAKRFITVQMEQNFFGKEDKDLTPKLLAERSGILNLALDALDRLRERRHPLQPKSGVAMGRDLTRLTSDISAFIEDRCEVGPDAEAYAHKLFEVWEGWCREHRVSYGYGLAQFTAKLRSAAEAPIRDSRPRSGGPSRPTMLHGIGLRKPRLVIPAASDGSA